MLSFESMVHSSIHIPGILLACLRDKHPVYRSLALFLCMTVYISFLITDSDLKLILQVLTWHAIMDLVETEGVISCHPNGLFFVKVCKGGDVKPVAA